MDGGQGPPDLAAQHFHPIPFPRKHQIPLLPAGPVFRRLPQAGLLAVRLRRDFKGDPLFFSDLCGKDGKGGGQTQTHFPAGRLHVFLYAFVHAKVYHNLCHECHSSQHKYIIAYVKQISIYFFTILQKLSHYPFSHRLRAKRQSLSRLFHCGKGLLRLYILSETHTSQSTGSTKNHPAPGTSNVLPRTPKKNSISAEETRRRPCSPGVPPGPVSNPPGVYRNTSPGRYSHLDWDDPYPYHPSH